MATSVQTPTDTDTAGKSVLNRIAFHHVDLLSAFMDIELYIFSIAAFLQNI